MKHVFRVLTFVYIAVAFAESLLPFFSFGNDYKTKLLFILLLFLLFNFKKAILKAVTLPYEGLLYLVISFILTVVIINIFSVLFATFHIESVTTPNLIILGVVLTSYSLSKFWSGVLAALIISLTYNYLSWLTTKKK